MAVGLQTGADRVGDRGFVLDDEYAQGPILRSTGLGRRRVPADHRGEHPVKLR